MRFIKEFKHCVKRYCIEYSPEGRYFRGLKSKRVKKTWKLSLDPPQRKLRNIFGGGSKLAKTN